MRRKVDPPAESVPCRAAHPNHVWTYDFLEDATFSGSKLRLLTVVDEFTRECLKIEVATSFPADRVLRTFEGGFRQYGIPQFLRSDNRDECLDRETFLSVAEAQIGSERYRRHYNGERPHSSLGYRTPLEFKLEFKKEWMENRSPTTQ